ncbi:retrovirus-related pol polyprotein from transposon TNT 1-94 [Tanacetum coccineum]
MLTSNTHQQSLADAGSAIRPPMLERERNDIIFPNVTVNTKFLNCLQREWLKYSLLKYLSRKKIDSRAKKVEKSHDPLALVAHTGSSSRTTAPYYVTHPSSVVDYDEDYQGDAVSTNSKDPPTSVNILLARNSITTQRISLISTNKPSSYFLQTIESAILQMEEIKELSANICLIARIQPTKFDSDEGPTYDSAFLSETIDYNKLNALYEDFVPQEEFPAEQKYFSSSFISSENSSNASSSYSSSETKPTVTPIPSANPMLKNFIEKFLGTVRFGNDHFAAITSYGDYVQGSIIVCHVYYVEDLGHNLFSVGQFCDGDLEVAFCSKTCYVRNLEGDDLLTGDRESNLYTISISNMAASSPVCLMSKATSTKSWLWHRRLSHLNFGKIKKASHPPKVVPSNHSKLELLHIDICGPMRTLEIIKNLIAQVQLNYNAKVCKIHTDNGTEFKNATLKSHYDKLGIMQQYSISHTPQQNGVVGRPQQVHNHEDSPSTISIVVEEHEAPPIVTTFEEQTSPISFNEADELNQEDSADFDGNTIFVPYDAPNFEEAESSTTTLDPSNMHEFHQVQPSKHIWTKGLPLEQVISDLSKPVMNRQRLQTDYEHIRRLTILKEKLMSWSSKKQDCTTVSTAEDDIGASSSVPWINLGQFWHTLKEDGSKYRLKFVLEKKDLTLTPDDFRIIFPLPQAINNNHEHFVAAPKFSKMVSFYINNLCFTLELRSPSNFKMTRLVQPWQTLGKIFARCPTTRATRLHYLLEHPSTLIPYPKFTKLIVSHYMNAFLEISRRARDKYHNFDNDMMVKNIFNSRKHKDKVGMKILSWMITDEMKLMENYQMYDVVFGVDVPMTQSQPVESTQGTHRTISSPRSPNPEMDEGESRALIAEEIEKLVEGAENVENVEDDSSTLRQNDTQNIPGARLELMSNKESPKVEITTVDQPINTIEEEEESVEDDYKLRRREKGKHVEESRSTSSPTKIRSLRTHSTLISSDTEKLQELMPGCFKQYRSFFDEFPGRYGYLSENLKTRPFAVRPRDQDDPHDDAHPEGENSPSTSGNQEQLDDFDFWTDSYATYDDEIPTQKVPQELMDEMSHTVDEEKLGKVTYWELGHEHKFITDIVARRANGSIVSITESDYKNLNKNDIEDMYLLIVNNKVDDYAETSLLWSLSVFIRSTVIWGRVFFIVSEPVYGIIYKNSKKEKRVMRHQKVHKFCDATLKRVLEGLKSYNNDVKHGYVISSLSNEDAEYLQLFKEETEERLKHRNQMRWWEMYVNRRRLGSRRERPE